MTLNLYKLKAFLREISEQYKRDQRGENKMGSLIPVKVEKFTIYVAIFAMLVTQVIPAGFASQQTLLTQEDGQQVYSIHVDEVENTDPVPAYENQGAHEKFFEDSPLSMKEESYEIIVQEIEKVEVVAVDEVEIIVCYGSDPDTFVTGIKKPIEVAETVDIRTVEIPEIEIQEAEMRETVLADLEKTMGLTREELKELIEFDDINIERGSVFIQFKEGRMGESRLVDVLGEGTVPAKVFYHFKEGAIVRALWDYLREEYGRTITATVEYNEGKIDNITWRSHYTRPPCKDLMNCMITDVYHPRQLTKREYYSYEGDRIVIKSVKNADKGMMEEWVEGGSFSEITLSKIDSGEYRITKLEEFDENGELKVTTTFNWQDVSNIGLIDVIYRVDCVTFPCPQPTSPKRNPDYHLTSIMRTDGDGNVLSNILTRHPYSLIHFKVWPYIAPSLLEQSFAFVKLSDNSVHQVEFESFDDLLEKTRELEENSLFAEQLIADAEAEILTLLENHGITMPIPADLLDAAYAELDELREMIREILTALRDELDALGWGEKRLEYSEPVKVHSSVMGEVFRFDGGNRNYPESAIALEKLAESLLRELNTEIITSDIVFHHPEHGEMIVSMEAFTNLMREIFWEWQQNNRREPTDGDGHADVLAAFPGLKPEWLPENFYQSFSVDYNLFTYPSLVQVMMLQITSPSNLDYRNMAVKFIEAHLELLVDENGHLNPDAFEQLITTGEYVSVVYEDNFGEGKLVIERIIDLQGNESTTARIQVVDGDGVRILRQWQVADLEINYGGAASSLNFMNEEGDKVFLSVWHQDQAEDTLVVAHLEGTFRKATIYKPREVSGQVELQKVKIEFGTAFEGNHNFVRETLQVIKWEYDEEGNVTKEMMIVFGEEQEEVLWVEADYTQVDPLKTRVNISVKNSANKLDNVILTGVEFEFEGEERTSQLVGLKGTAENGDVLEIQIIDREFVVTRTPVVEVIYEASFGDGSMVIEEENGVKTLRLFGSEGHELESFELESYEVVRGYQSTWYSRMQVKVVTTTGAQIDFRSFSYNFRYRQWSYAYYQMTEQVELEGIGLVQKSVTKRMIEDELKKTAESFYIIETRTYGDRTYTFRRSLQHQYWSYDLEGNLRSHYFSRRTKDGSSLTIRSTRQADGSYTKHITVYKRGEGIVLKKTIESGLVVDTNQSTGLIEHVSWDLYTTIDITAQTIEVNYFIIALPEPIFFETTDFMPVLRDELVNHHNTEVTSS